VLLALITLFILFFRLLERPVSLQADLEPITALSSGRASAPRQSAYRVQVSAIDELATLVRAFTR